MSRRDWREEHREGRFKWPLKLPQTKVEGVSTLEEAQEVMDSKIRTGGSYRTYGSNRFTDEGAKRVASFNRRWQRKVFRQAMRIIDTKLADSEAPNFRAKLGERSGEFGPEHQDVMQTLLEMGVEPEQIERRSEDA